MFICPAQPECILVIVKGYILHLCYPSALCIVKHSKKGININFIVSLSIKFLKQKW